MNSRSTPNSSRPRRAAIAALAAGACLSLFLGACVEVDASIRMGTGGAGTLAISYRLPASLRYVLSDPAQPWEIPIPRSRAEAEALIAGKTDISLTDFVSNEDAATVEYRMDYGFRSAENLNALLRSLGAQASSAASGGSGSFSVALAALPSPPPQDLEGMLIALYGPSRLSLRFTPPGPARTQRGGRIELGDAVFEATTNDLSAYGKSPVWEVSW